MIGDRTEKKQYIFQKVKRNDKFIKEKKEKLITLMKRDYAVDPEYWGKLLFGGKTVKEIIEEHERTH